MKILAPSLILLLTFFLPCAALNILFHLPCNGGQFITMSSLFETICTQYNCTIVTTTNLCTKKLEPYHKNLKLDVIKKHVLPDEYWYDGKLDFMMKFCPSVLELFNETYMLFTDIMEKRRNDFDLLITNQVFWSSLVVAETFNLPAIVQMPGVPGGLEHIQDKIPYSVFDSLVMKVSYRNCWDWLDTKRLENKLPPLDFQGHFTLNEYASRFPMFIPTVPSFYPKPHSSADYVYIGGPRDEKYAGEFDPKLKKWIDSNDLPIVYVSLGTHAIISGKEQKSFYEKVRSQNKYRVIWYLSLGLQKTAEEMSIFSQSDPKIYLSDFLPQYTLLGYEKVKIFVTHAGLGSSVDMMKQKVPGIFVPRFFDQPMHSIFMENLYLGVTAQKFDFENVDKAIETIMENYDFYQKYLETIYDEFSVYEKPELINKFIEKVAAKRRVSVRYRLPYKINSQKVFNAWNWIIISALFAIFAATVLLFLIVRHCCSQASSKVTPRVKFD